MKRLKEATSQQHRDLENDVDVMRESISIEDYGRLLLKFYRFYKPLEDNLEGIDFADTGYDFEERRKLPALEADLRHLGLLDTARNESDFFRGVPEPEGLTAAFGVLYVLEGATLGGQIIKRHLQETLGIGPDSGGRFFSGYGPETGLKWKEFGSIVEAFVAEKGGENEMIGAARATFDSFRKSFVEAAVAA